MIQCTAHESERDGRCACDAARLTLAALQSPKTKATADHTINVVPFLTCAHGLAHRHLSVFVRPRLGQNIAISSCEPAAASVLPLTQHDTKQAPTSGASSVAIPGEATLLVSDLSCIGSQKWSRDSRAPTGAVGFGKRTGNDLLKTLTNLDRSSEGPPGCGSSRSRLPRIAWSCGEEYRRRSAHQ